MFQTCHDLQLICVVTCCSETANFKYVCFVQSLEHKHHGLAAAVGADGYDSFPETQLYPEEEQVGCAMDDPYL